MAIGLRIPWPGDYKIEPLRPKYLQGAMRVGIPPMTREPIQIHKSHFREIVQVEHGILTVEMRAIWGSHVVRRVIRAGQWFVAGRLRAHYLINETNNWVWLRVEFSPGPQWNERDEPEFEQEWHVKRAMGLREFRQR